MMKKGGGHLLAGLSRKSPPGDSGMRPPSGSVDTDATRSSVAPTPKTLGPRDA